MADEPQNELVRLDESPTGLNIWSSVQNFELGQRMAVALYTSDIAPEKYRGEQNIGNCLIALDMAQRLNLSPLTIMQNLNVIKGKPTFGATFMVALINSCGKFKTPLRYEVSGTPFKDDWCCRAYATDVYGDKLYGSWVSLRMAKDEGWYGRNDKWKNMPEQMLRYRSATFFFRLYCPELAVGFQTTEEVEDMNIIDVPNHQVTEVEIPAAGVQEPPLMAELVENAKPEARKVELNF